MQLPTRIVSTTLALAALVTARARTAKPASAPAAPVSLETIHVTADLWESPLTRIPASVSVYDERALRSASVRHFGDLVDQIPNLTWTGTTSRPRYLQIRGIGENSQYEGETPDSAVRFLVDDLDFTGLGSLASTFDVRQLEVLRGPQAGAFGANAAGGVVRLVTNEPTPFWTGQVEGNVGEDGLRSGGLAVGGPLLTSRPDKLMMRVAAQRSSDDGFRFNRTLKRETNDRDELAGRLRLTWNPNALWRWDATLLGARLDNGFDEFALNNNGHFTYSDQPGRDEQESVAASLRGGYRGWEGARFATVTSGARTRSRYSYDDDWTAASYEGFSDLTRTRRVVNQELRLDSDAKNSKPSAGIDRWTVGAFFSSIDEDSRYTNEDPWTLRGLSTDYKARNTAIFGQASHAFTSDRRLIVGLRAEQIDLEGAGVKTRLDKESGIHEPVVTTRPAFDDTLFGGKLTLEQDLGSAAMGFLSITRGYKAGGINVDARIDTTRDPLTYETETLWNYEAGLRGRSLEGHLTGELTAFYLQRRDTQVRDSAGFGGSYRFFTDNGQDSHVYGLESAGAWSLTPEWSLRGSLALMQSELEPFRLRNGNRGGSRDLANTPHYGYMIGMRYGDGGGWFGDAELVGRASQLDSNTQNESRRSFRIVNTTIGYSWGRWTVALWAKNLFDEEYDKRVFFFGNEDPDYIETRYEDRADPRQFGARATFRF